MEGLELLSFQIISAVGTSRFMYIEAIELGKEGKIEEARKMIEEGEQVFTQFCLLLIHFWISHISCMLLFEL